jgi:hypothetical protein
MPDQGASDHAVSLSLADGFNMRIVAADAWTAEVVSRLQAAMQLDRATTRADPAIIARTGPAAGCALAGAAPSPWSVYWTLGIPRQLGTRHDTPTLQLIGILIAVCLWAQARGAVLVHGALAELNGRGIILAGRGGAGKTTASERLPPPWRSLSDDATLVVRDARGIYWAHPWPTWSRFILEEGGGSWDVQQHVRLLSAFFLAQADKDLIAALGPGQATVRLLESSEQAWLGMSPFLPREELQASRLQRFDNICALARTVPCYELHLSLTGAFWERIERVLDEEERR